MKKLIQDFTLQLKESLIIGQNYSFKASKKEFANIVLTGLGGSGIGGSIVQNYSFDKLNVPFIVNKDYFLPSFIGQNSLVIVSSYSGNTEETVASLKQALKMKATVICITSGGQIAELAKKKNIDCILMPAGMPPRACIGYSMIQVLYVLAHFGYIKDNFEKDIKASIKLLETESKNIRQEAKNIAKKLLGKLPIVYAASDFEGTAVRFRQQLNENSKMLAWQNVIPEMNHNELVGWRDKDPRYAVVLLRTDIDYERVQLRMDINKKVIKKYTPTLIEIYAKGRSYWEKVFYFIHLTDWVSVLLAEMRELDATEVKVIDFLKGELSKA